MVIVWVCALGRERERERERKTEKMLRNVSSVQSTGVTREGRNERRLPCDIQTRFAVRMIFSNEPGQGSGKIESQTMPVMREAREVIQRCVFMCMFVHICVCVCVGGGGGDNKQCKRRRKKRDERHSKNDGAQRKGTNAPDWCSSSARCHVGVRGQNLQA